MAELNQLDVNTCFKTASVLSLLVSLVSLSIKTGLVCLHGLTPFKKPVIELGFPPLLLIASVMFLRGWVRPIWLKRVAIVVWAEAISWMCLQTAENHSEVRVVFASTALCLVLVFEVKAVNSLSGTVVLLINHFYQWHFDYTNFPIEPRTLIVLIPLAAIIFLFLILFIQGANAAKRYEKSQQAVKDSEQNLTTLIETLGTGLIVLARDFTVKRMNQCAKHLLSCSAGEIPERLNTLVCEHWRDAVLVRSTVLQLMENNQAVELGTCVGLGCTIVNGAYINVSFSQIQWDRDSAYVLMLTDITESILLEHSHTDSQLKTKFLRFIPHELRTPTVGILGCVENMMGKLNSLTNEELQDGLQVIFNSGRLMHFMIGSIVDYTEMISGVFELALSQTNIRKIVAEVTSIFQHQLRRQNIRLTVRIDPSTPEEVLTDSNRLGEALVALMSNSLKYTQQGFIELIVTMNSPAFLTFELVDSGIGIAPERLQFIHQQLQSSTSHEMMFRLELVNGIVRDLGGQDLTIQSDRGTSVRFRVKIQEVDDHHFEEINGSFACESMSEGCEYQMVPTFHFSHRAPQVLIVDDTDNSRAVLCDLLKSQHITVGESKNGQSAVDLVRHYDSLGGGIQVVIMDIEMPVMNGWQATEKITELFNTGVILAKPAIIGYSAYSSPEFTEKSRLVGMVSYIVKPANACDLVSAVKSFLQ